jgi:FkbM family methyltransferase
VNNSSPHPLIRRLLRGFGHQHWLRFGIRDRILRAFHPPDRAANIPFVCRFDGHGLYTGNFQSFIDWSVYYFGSFCQEELDLLAGVASRFSDPIFLDIGANSGSHTLFLSPRVSWVYAFDPFPEALTQLRRQISINKLSNVTVVPTGLGSRDASLPFGTPSGNNRGVGAFLAQEPPALSHAVGSNLLPVRHPDSLLSELGIKVVNLIKIDTEGFEVEILLGLAKTLERDSPIVFFEWSQPARSFTASANAVSWFPAGYSFYQVLPPSNRFGLLTRGRYRLQPLSGKASWPLANVLATPT